MTGYRQAMPLIAAAGALLLLSSPTIAGDVRTERLQFKRGASSATVTGTLKGDQTVDYLVGASKGQSANVSLATNNTATYFNILAPGQNEVAFFNGSVNGNQFEGVLPETGDYRIRVYMMRSAARRNEVANYRLEVAIAPGTNAAASTQPAAGASAAAPATDAKVAGTGFHATGNIPCSMGGGQPTGQCAYGVTREGQGNGMVTVTKPDGRKCVIFFEKGRATGYDASQADRGTFSASRQSDLTTIRIGEERYEIPDAVITGG
jgi:hypothetical protein